MKLAFSKDAESDLEEIGDYIARDSPRYARQMISELRAKARDLLNMPERFTVVGEVAGVMIRRRPYSDYSIFYFVDRASRMVVIARILHSARDHERILFPED